MASKNYFEDGGTATAYDDYGYDGLKGVLTGRFQRAEDIRYSMKYSRVRRQENRAYVQVLIHASYSIKTHRGDERMDKKDQNELVLVWTGDKWMFVSGM